MMLASSVVRGTARHQGRRALSSASALNQFSDEEKMLKEAVKKWAEAEVKPLVRKMDEEKKMVRLYCSKLVTWLVDGQRGKWHYTAFGSL